MTVTRDTDAPSQIYHAILAVLLLMLLTQPVISQTVLGVRPIALLWGAIFVGSLLTVRHRKALFVSGLALMLPTIVLRVTAPLPPAVILWRDGLAVASFLFVAVVFLVHVLTYRRITAAAVSASLCVYIIVGMVWAIAYGMVEQLAAGSFNGLDYGSDLGRQFVYFSYVTLTTLGYGDITPARPVVQTMATVEAITGQLFLVGLVAYLVGRTVAGARD